jgi:hypothetical protein
LIDDAATTFAAVVAQAIAGINSAAALPDKSPIRLRRFMAASPALKTQFRRSSVALATGGRPRFR